jgi:hypothetical protein
MTPDDVLGKIINHEMLVEEAKYMKNLSKSIVSTKKDNIALKASKKSKKKQILVESSSEEEQEDDEEDEDKEYDEEEMSLFTKKLNKYKSKRRPFKGDKKQKTRSKRVCYNYGKNEHFIAQCHMRGKIKMRTRKERRTRTTRKTRSS